MRLNHDESTAGFCQLASDSRDTYGDVKQRYPISEGELIEHKAGAIVIDATEKNIDSA